MTARRAQTSGPADTAAAGGFLRSTGLALALAMVVLAVYGQVRTHSFLQFDDAAYVTENGAVRTGLTWAGLRWAFTTPYAGNWHPLTWVSHMADVQWFGLDPGAHLMTNVVLHAGSSVLLLLVLASVTRSVWSSALVAALFALHPLRVESVAWVAERKDVLSTFCWMLTVGAYVRYVRRPSAGRYSAVVVAFALALLSKPMVVTLPFALMLLDVWPLRRWSGLGDAGGNALELRALAREKWPLFAMAATTGVMTIVAQRMAGAVQSLEVLPIPLRLMNAPVSYVRYLAKTVWPVDLAALYPYPASIPLWQWLGALIVLGTVTVSVLRMKLARPYLAVGWFWFLGTLAPVIGLLQVGSQPYADRFTYVPAIGLYIIVAWGTAELVRGRATLRRAAAVLATSVLVVITLVSHRQVDVWRDSVTLWQHAVDVTDRNYRAHANLGFALAEQRSFSQAIVEYERAIALDSEYAPAHNYLGLALNQTGDHARAETEFRTAIRLRPRFAAAHNNLGLTLRIQGRHADAMAAFSEAIRLDPGFAPARNNLGTSLAERGEFARAIDEFSAALAIQPESAETHVNLGMALVNARRQAEALRHFEEALSLGGDTARVNYAWGVALADLGRLDEALARLTASVERNAAFAPAFYELGRVLAAKGLLPQAAQALEAALRIDPAYEDAREALRQIRGR